MNRLTNVGDHEDQHKHIYSSHISQADGESVLYSAYIAHHFHIDSEQKHADHAQPEKYIFQSLAKSADNSLLIVLPSSDQIDVIALQAFLPFADRDDVASLFCECDGKLGDVYFGENVRMVSEKML